MSFQSLLKDLTTADLPKLNFTGAVITKKNSEQLKIDISLGLLENIDTLQNTGLLSGDEIVNKYLKFKVFFIKSEVQGTEIADKLEKYVFLDSINDTTITFENFKNTGIIRDGKNLFNTRLEKTISGKQITDVPYFSILLVPFYDKSSISRDFSIDLTNADGIEKYFIGEPQLFSIINNGQLSKNVLELSVLESVKELLFSDLKPIAAKADYFSDIFATYDNNLYHNVKLENKQYVGGSNIVRFGFFFDLARYMRENAVFGTLITSLDEKVKTDFLTNSKIINATLFRKNHKKDVYGDEDYKVVLNNISQTPGDSLLAEQRIEDLPNLLFFTGIDTDINNYTNGQFKYGIELEISDPSIDILETIKRKLSKATHLLNSYLVLINKPSISTINEFDTNQHIDTSRENIIGKVSKGFYDSSIDKVSIAAYEKIREAGLEEISDYFVKIYSLFLEGQPPIVPLESLKSLIELSLKPPTASKDSIKVVIGLIDQLYARVSFILDSVSTDETKRQLTSGQVSSTDQLSRTPNFKKLLKITNTFNNFIADASVSDGFGLNCFDRGQETTYTLESFTLSDEDFKNPNKNLKNITYRGKNREPLTIDIQGLEIKENPTVEYSAFSSIDFLLNLYGKPQFETVLSNFFKENIISQQYQTYFRLGSVGSVLENVNVTAFTSIGKFFEKGLNTTGQSSNLDTAARERLNTAVSMVDSLLLEKLAVGIINNGRITNNKTIFQNKMDFYKTDAESPVSKTVGIEEFYDAKLAKMSKFKLKHETIFGIFKIDFSKDDNGHYLLKQPIYTKINESDKSKHLCTLIPYTSPKALLSKPNYDNIPVHNKVFLLEYSATPATTQQANVLQGSIDLTAADDLLLLKPNNTLAGNIDTAAADELLVLKPDVMVMNSERAMLKDENVGQKINLRSNKAVIITKKISKKA